MDKQAVITIGLTLGFLVPMLVTTSIIWHSENTSTLKPVQPTEVYLQQGPGYVAAKQAGFIQFSGNNTDNSETTIEFHKVPGTGETVLTNVLEFENNVVSGSRIDVWVNGSLPSGVTMYLSSNKVTASGTVIMGSNVTTLNGTFVLHISGPADGVFDYASFKTYGTSSNSAEIRISYVVP